MEILNLIFTAIGVFLGGGGTWIFLIKSSKRKAQAEAMKDEQNVYQETIKDLREDKRILKEERDEGRDRYNELLDKYNDLQDKYKGLASSFEELRKSVSTMQDDIQSLKKKNEKENCINFKCAERIKK